MKFISIFVLLLFSVNAFSAKTAEWVRYPVISPDGSSIVFTYKGDLYRVPVNGGEALRLTFHEAHDHKAVWHPDGDKIAFASDRHGNWDVYVMDANGGQATRLTFHSTNELPYSFSANGESVVFGAFRMDTADHRQGPSSTFTELYEVPMTGGRVDQILTTPAQEVDFDEDGTKMLYQDVTGRENEWRKHHRSAVTKDIWLYDVNKESHTQLTKFAGEDRDPVFSPDGESFYYLSEQNGSFNVFKASIESPDSATQLTEFELHPVRFLSIGNGTLVFTHHGQLYSMSEGDSPQAVDVKIRTQDTANNISIESIGGEISEMLVSPSGDEIALVAMGDVFIASTDGAYVKQITKTPEREAFVSFSSDGDAIYYAAERDAQWGIYKSEKAREEEPFFYAASLINESTVLVNGKDNTQPKVSPDGKKIAFVEDRRTLRVMDISGKNAKTLVDRDETLHFRVGDQDFHWSPDSQWILFTHDRLLNNNDIALVKADGSDPFKPLSLSGFYDYSPKWVNNGKQVLWFSNREGLRSLATSGGSQADIYSLFFNQDDWDKFRLSEDDYELQQAIDEANAEESEEDEASDEETASEEEEAEVEPMNIQWDGLDDRIAKLTIHSSRLSDAVLNKEAGTLYYLTRFEDDVDLWTTNLRTQETKKLINLGVNGGSLQWDKDYETLYLLSGGDIRKLDVNDGSSEFVSINHRVEVDNAKLREYTFETVWRHIQKAFYEPTYHGVDWDQMYKEYQPKVAHLGNGMEMAELLSEMIGELNVSHAGARYRYFSRYEDNTAHLGIFFDYDHTGNGIKITEVINGGPLDKAGYNISEGMIIEKIDGVQITPDFDWAKLLNNKADKFVLLDIMTNKGDTRQLTVKPVGDWELRGLLYQRFVDINEQEVLELSDNTLGYVHIPGMNDGAYRNVFDTMMGKHFDKKGMVVDTRFNGGGDLVADLAMFFTGEKFLTYATEDRVVGGEPTSRYTKPVVTLFNEDMYSDGHCYASGFQDLNLGTSVGMPVPGTCSFAGGNPLPTGGRYGIVPISAKNKAGEWLENNQTSPDILIKNMPDKISDGTDQQLEKAVEVLMDQTSE